MLSEMTTCRSGIVGKEVEYVTWDQITEPFESRAEFRVISKVGFARENNGIQTQY